MKELSSKRLHYRKIKDSDAKRIFDCWASDEEVTRYLTWYPHKSVEDTKKIVRMWLDDYEKEDCYRYGIELLGGADLIGMIDVIDYLDGCPMIGYVLGKEYWNKGYMTEALKKICDYLFEEGFDKILIRADEDNIGSNKVIQKCGFDFLYTKRQIKSSFKPETTRINFYEKIR